VRIYSDISLSSVLVDGIPDFVFPNNQQTLGNYLNELKLGFIQILSRMGNLLLVLMPLYLPIVKIFSLMFLKEVLV
jgi:hypothetical protein